jgi:hypothetical protein
MAEDRPGWTGLARHEAAIERRPNPFRPDRLSASICQARASQRHLYHDAGALSLPRVRGGSSQGWQQQAQQGNARDVRTTGAASTTGR